MARSKKNIDLNALQTRLLRKKNNDKGGGSKKYGRNRAKCALYRDRRSHTNKLAKLRAHLAHHPHDGCAIHALEVARTQI